MISYDTELIFHEYEHGICNIYITSSSAVAVFKHETGILTSTKVKKTGSKRIDVSVYATTNDIDAISKPFRSRFMEFSLPPYTYDEFCEIAVNLLRKRYNHDEELSVEIADTILNKIKSKDVRDLLQVGKLSKTVSDVDFVANTLQKYRGKKGYED